jgi:hypothetical protein
MKKLLVMVLVVLTATLGFGGRSNVHGNSSNQIIKQDFNKLNYGVIKNVPNINFNKSNFLFETKDLFITNNIEDVNDIYEQIQSGKFVFNYDKDGNVYNYLYNDQLDNVYAISYYLDNDGLLNICTLTYSEDTNRSDGKLKENDIKDYYYKKANDYFLEKENNELTAGIQAVVLNSTDDFTVPKASYEKTVIHSNKYGYIIMKSLLFRKQIENFFLYRVESRVQLTSGDAAVETGYNSNYKSKKALITGILEKNVVYGYGTWYSNQPQLVDYFPMNAPRYRTITSGINLSLTLGRTTEVGVSGGDNGFGISGSAKLESSVGISYFYQSSETFEIPRMNAMELSQEEGAAWEYTDFSKDPDTSVTVYPGMLIEVIKAPYQASVDGKYTFTVDFKVDQYTKNIFGKWVEKPFVSEKTIFGEQVIYLDHSI